MVVQELSPQAKPKVADLSCRSVECSESLQDPLPEGLWIGPLTLKQTYQVKVPPHLIEEVRDYIQGLLNKGIIKKTLEIRAV